MRRATRYDYIIVGAESAGCVLANRLSEDPGVQVMLLEAGGSDRNIFIQMPTALSIPMNMKQFNWGFESEPEPWMGHRRLHCPRGKGLGGSSSINGMVYVRGHPCDFDEWEELGAKLPHRRGVADTAAPGPAGPLPRCVEARSAGRPDEPAGRLRSRPEEARLSEPSSAAGLWAILRGEGNGSNGQ